MTVLVSWSRISTAMANVHSVKDLYLAKSLGDLQQIAKQHNLNLDGISSKLHITNAHKIYVEAVKALFERNEESSYVYFLRFSEVIAFVRKKEDFHRYKVHFDQLISPTKVKNATATLEKLTTSLESRYKLHNEALKRGSNNDGSGDSEVLFSGVSVKSSLFKPVIIATKDKSPPVIPNCTTNDDDDTRPLAIPQDATKKVEALPPSTNSDTISIASILKETTNILDKLTADNLEQSITRIQELPFKEKDDGQILFVANLIFETVINEQTTAKITLYARMIEAIYKNSNQTFEEFKQKIICQCRLEFHKKCLNENDTKNSFKNIRFMGELYKLDMIEPKIMVKCINLLMEFRNKESIERLCRLLTIIGPKLGKQLKSFVDEGETPNFIPEPSWMNKIFTHLNVLTEDRKFVSYRPKIRIVVDLWEKYCITNVNTPPCPSNANPTPQQHQLTSVQKKVNDPCSAPQQPKQTPPNRIHKEEPEDAVISSINRKTVAILNKITSENFAQSVVKFKELPLEDKDERINAVVNVLFERAINETIPRNFENYSKFLHIILKTSLETSKKFRKQILDQCQREFQRIGVDESEIKGMEQKLMQTTDINYGKDKELQQDLQEMKSDSMKRSLGNVRLIGELYKVQMLTPKIMMECVRLLLYKPDEGKVECLCVLLTVIGQKLDLQLKSLEVAISRGDKPNFIPEPNWMTKIFAQLKELSKDEKFSLKARCKILNVLELRNRNWNSSDTEKGAVMASSSTTGVGRRFMGTPITEVQSRTEQFQMHARFIELSQFLKNNHALKGTNQSCSLLLQTIKAYLESYLDTPPRGMLFKDAFSADLQKNLKKFRETYNFSTGMENAVNAILLEVKQNADYNRHPKRRMKILIDDYIERKIVNAVKAIAALGKEQICNGDVIMLHSITDAVINLLENAAEDGKTFELIVVKPTTNMTILLEILEDPIREKDITFSSISIETATTRMPNITKLLIGGHGLFTASGNVLAQHGSNHLAFLATSFKKPTIFLCEKYKICDRPPADLTSPDDQCQEKGLVTSLKINYDLTPLICVSAVITEDGRIVVNLIIEECTSYPSLHIPVMNLK